MVGITRFAGFLSTPGGGRKYPTLSATIEWEHGSRWGTVQEHFGMELTPWQTRGLRVRAWLHAILRLPAFSEHAAPLLIAALAPLARLVC